jgi:transposase
LLLLAEGESVEDVAGLLRVSRQTVYNLVTRFNERSALSVTDRLSDGVRGGRPATARSIISKVVQEVIETDPRKSGYAQTVWTASLLQRHIESVHGVRVGIRSIQSTLGELDLKWKRPRHSLSRRAPRWRQAKGG